MNNPEIQRKKLYNLLGDLPNRNRPISCKVISITKEKGYLLEKLLLDLNGIEKVPAYFVKPLKGDRFPCMLFNHAHGGNYVLGKDELIKGRDPYLQSPSYAEELASRGISSLCIDAWNFGERRGLKETELFKRMLWQGQVLWGMMVYDNLRAIDYLCSRQDLDKKRIGTIGLSMGSTMAWWTSALDIRVKVCIDICCLTDFQALIETRGLDEHGVYYYVPSLLKHFSTSAINALIAPRPHLSLAGNLDPLTPPSGLDRIDRELKRVYKKAGHPEAWKLLRYDVGHFETAEMRSEILAYLQKWL